MHTDSEKDTIVAVATPPGRGSLAGIRISGNDACKVVDLLLPAGKSVKDFLPNHLHVSWLFATPSTRLDQATLVRYEKPKSFTGEDVVEIFCHGGRLIASVILEALCQRGCRLAEPGEFTRRALLHGKLDLIQAEAIAEIVEADSPAYLQSTISHLEGVFSRKLGELREKILQTCALLELGLDFSEEDVEFASRETLSNDLDRLERIISDLLAGFKRGQALKEGWRIAIIGKPNVGKSSLMNALLRHDRVIVSEIPGTTRDTIDERIFLNGYLFRLIDTAGIREAAGEIEKIGIERSRRAAEDAEAILFVTDGSTDPDEEDERLAGECLEIARKKAQVVVIHVCNKTDLPPARKRFSLQNGFARIVNTSAITSAGVDELENAMIAAVAPKTTDEHESVFHINLRQKNCLEAALFALSHARNSLVQGLSAEFVVVDLHEVIHQLGALIGEVTTEDVLGEIFSKFCIGK